MSSAPLSFDTVVICDTIRQEVTGKYVLVGVYGTTINVRDFPADLHLSWWMTAKAHRLGNYNAEFRILGPHDAALIRGQLVLSIKDIERPFVLKMENVPIQLQSIGIMKFQIQFPEMEWQTLKEVLVTQQALKPVSRATPASVTAPSS